MQRSLAVATAASPETFVVDQAHSEVSFQVRHMLSKTRGRFTDFEGVIEVDETRPESSTVEFRVRSASVDTDQEQRDQHLRSADFFDADRYREVVFRSDRIRPAGEGLYEVTGTLSLRGVEKRITLPVTYLGVAKDPWGGERAGFSTAITLNRKDFGMVWNQALDHGGFVLGDEVWITIELEAIRQPAAA